MALPIVLVDGVVPVALDFMTLFQYLDDRISALGGAAALGSANQLSGVNGAGSAAEYKTVNGTANQVAVTHAASSLTLALTAVVAVASALAAGTNPAQSGALRLAKDGTIRWRNEANDGDVQGIGKNGSNQIVLGPGGAENVVMGGQLRMDLNTAARLVLPVGPDRWAV